MIQLAWVLLSFVTSANAQYTTLGTSVQEAKAELARIDAMIEKESTNTANVDPCKDLELMNQRKYTQWFLDHAADFQKADDEIASLSKTEHEKIELIKKAKVQVNPVPGQPGTLNVDYATLEKYFKDLNVKLAACAPDKRDVLLQVRESPAFNQPHIAHSQILAAAQLMAQNLNASLKENNESYSIEFKVSPNGYDLVLSSTIHFGEKSYVRSVSLFNDTVSGETASFDTLQDRWAFLVANSYDIDGYPADSGARYWKMRKETENKACPRGLELRSHFKVSPAPFMSAERVRSESLQEAKKSMATYAQYKSNSMFNVYTDQSSTSISPETLSDNGPYFLFVAYKHPLEGFDMIKLYQCSAGGDLFISIDSKCEKVNRVNEIGYVFKNPEAGLAPLRRYYNRTHRLRPESSSNIDSSYQPEMILGYSFALDTNESDY